MLEQQYGHQRSQCLYGQSDCKIHVSTTSPAVDKMFAKVLNKFEKRWIAHLKWGEALLVILSLYKPWIWDPKTPWPMPLSYIGKCVSVKTATLIFSVIFCSVCFPGVLCCKVWNSIYKPLHYPTLFQFLPPGEVQEWTYIGYKFAASYKHLKYAVIRYIFYVSKTIEDVLLEPLWLPFQKREFISWQFDMPCVFLKDNLKSTKGTKSI